MGRAYLTRRVCSRGELELTLRLVHDRYVEQGYMEPRPSGLRVGIHYAFPDTRTFAGFVDAALVSTVTLFFDSPLGLPLEKVYPKEVQRMRSAGRSLAEAGMLADRREDFRRGFREQLRVMRLAYWTALDRGIDDLLVGVNPKHVGFYSRVLCFDECGSLREYAAVCGAPVVLLRLDLASATPGDVPRDGIRRLFLPPPKPHEIHQGYRMTRQDLPYFFVRKTDLFAHLTFRERLAVEAAYPGLDVAAMVESFAGGRRTRELAGSAEGVGGRGP